MLHLSDRHKQGNMYNNTAMGYGNLFLKERVVNMVKKWLSVVLILAFALSVGTMAFAKTRYGEASLVALGNGHGGGNGGNGGNGGGHGPGDGSGNGGSGPHDGTGYGPGDGTNPSCPGQECPNPDCPQNVTPPQ
jgi:hypothetical protein